MPLLTTFAGCTARAFSQLGLQPVLRSYATANSGVSNVSSITVNIPAGTVDGDLMLALLNSSGGSPVWTASGWTPITENDTRNAIIMVKTASSEGASQQFNSSQSEKLSATIVTYKNAKLGFTGSFGSMANPAIAPSSTVPVVPAALVGFFNSERSGATFSTPTGMTAVASETAAAAFAIFDQVVTAGASGTRSSTLSGTGDPTGRGATVSLVSSGYIIPTPVIGNTTQTQNAVTGASLVLTLPTGTQEGDLLLAIMGADGGSSTWSNVDGWTELVDQGASPDLSIAWKSVGASEPASWTFTSSSASRRLGGGVIAFRGGAIDQTGSVASSSDLVTATAITPTANYSLLLAVALTNSSSRTFTTLSPMTSILSESDANGPSYAVFSQAAPAADSGSRTMNANTLASPVVGVLISIKPA